MLKEGLLIDITDTTFNHLSFSSDYSGHKKYSAWLAKVPYILSVITIATDEMEF